MKSSILSRVSLVLLALILIAFGVFHFVKPQSLINYVPSWLPGGIVWVYLVGAAFILAAIAFLAHKKVREAALLLAVLLFSFALLVHLPNYINGGNPDFQQVSLINLLKDVAIGSFALFIAANASKI